MVGYIYLIKNSMIAPLSVICWYFRRLRYISIIFTIKSNKMKIPFLRRHWLMIRLENLATHRPRRWLMHWHYIDPAVEWPPVGRIYVHITYVRGLQVADRCKLRYLYRLIFHKTRNGPSRRQTRWFLIIFTVFILRNCFNMEHRQCKKLVYWTRSDHVFASQWQRKVDVFWGVSLYCLLGD